LERTFAGAGSGPGELGPGRCFRSHQHARQSLPDRWFRRGKRLATPRGVGRVAHEVADDGLRATGNSDSRHSRTGL
jgi:hypothetical protein